jgi:hypothetical protein
MLTLQQYETNKARRETTFQPIKSPENGFRPFRMGKF